MSEATLTLETELLALAGGKKIPTQASMIETLALVLSLAVDADDGISRARAFEVMEVAVHLAELDFRLLSSGTPGCRAVPDAEDTAIDESLVACRILGIDTSGDYDYLGTLRALVAERDAAKAALTATGLDYGRGLVHGIQALHQQIRVDHGIINLFDRNRKRTLAALAAAGVAPEDTDTGVATLAAERDEARRDAAHLRKPYTVARRRDEVTDWAAEAIARAPLLVGLCASSTSMGPAPAELFRVMNDSPRGPLTLTQEGAVEVFLEEGPAAMVALVEERDELRLEILALRGDKAGAVSERWAWYHPCWSIFADDGVLLAKVATTNLLAWTKDGTEQATSIRDGMRQCEARLAGGGSC